MEMERKALPRSLFLSASFSLHLFPLHVGERMGILSESPRRARVAKFPLLDV